MGQNDKSDANQQAHIPLAEKPNHVEHVDYTDHSQHADPANHSEHIKQNSLSKHHGLNPNAPQGHESHVPVDHHAMMVADFRRRFFFSIILMIPILALSPMIQMFIGVNWHFPGDSYLLFGLSTILFFYGGWPFIKGSKKEISEKSPAMMTLITLAIVVAYVYSSLTIFILEGSDFFWELATLIVIMLLGHWIEMRSVMGASRALDELVKIMPEEAHVIHENGELMDMPIASLKTGSRILVKPGEKNSNRRKGLRRRLSRQRSNDYWRSQSRRQDARR